MLKPITLKNGLTIIRLPKANSTTFLVGFAVATGSSVEEGYFPQGISYLIERLFWCGTDKHPSTRSLNLTLEGMGGNFTSLTNQETSQYYLLVPSYHQHKAVSMLAEVIQRSFFEAKDIEKEKKLIIERIKEFEDTYELDNQLALTNLYQGHSLRMPVRGTLDSILAIQEEEVLEYLAHQYRPDKSFLILAGNFDNKGLVELVEQEWNFWNPRTKKFLEPMEFHSEDVGELPRVVYRQRGTAQTQLVVGFLLDHGLQHFKLTNKLDSEEADPDNQPDPAVVLEETLQYWAELLVLNTIIGQGLSSRLWSKAVEEEMLFSAIQSDLVRFKDTGYLQIMGLTDNTQFSFALESILSVIEALKKTTVSINELAKAKEFLKGKLILEQEDLLSGTLWQIENLLGTELTFSLDDLIEKINHVEAPNLRALASSLFQANKMIISTLGPAKETRLVEKLIKKYLG